MIMLAVVWLVQDFVQVFVMGLLMAPDIFLLSLLMMALLPGVSRERQISLIWAAFIGGLLWDLRWTNLPGLTAAVNCATVSLSCVLWQKAPVQGRTPVLFAFFAGFSALALGLVHFAFWTIPNQAAIRQLVIQQLMSVPVLALVSFLFWKVSDRYV